MSDLGQALSDIMSGTATSYQLFPSDKPTHLEFEVEKNFDHTFRGHFSVVVKSSNRHKIYSCTKCPVSLEGKLRAMQHIAQRRPPGSSEKVRYCNDPNPVVRELIQSYWRKKDENLSLKRPIEATNSKLKSKDLKKAKNDDSLSDAIVKFIAANDLPTTIVGNEEFKQLLKVANKSSFYRSNTRDYEFHEGRYGVAVEKVLNESRSEKNLHFMGVESTGATLYFNSIIDHSVGSSLECVLTCPKGLYLLPTSVQKGEILTAEQVAGVIKEIGENYVFAVCLRGKAETPLYREIEEIIPNAVAFSCPNQALDRLLGVVLHLFENETKALLSLAMFLCSNDRIYSELMCAKDSPFVEPCELKVASHALYCTSRLLCGKTAIMSLFHEGRIHGLTSSYHTSSSPHILPAASSFEYLCSQFPAIIEDMENPVFWKRYDAFEAVERPICNLFLTLDTTESLLPELSYRYDMCMDECLHAAAAIVSDAHLQPLYPTLQKDLHEAFDSHRREVVSVWALAAAMVNPKYIYAGGQHDLYNPKGGVAAIRAAIRKFFPGNEEGEEDLRTSVEILYTQFRHKEGNVFSSPDLAALAVTKSAGLWWAYVAEMKVENDNERIACRFFRRLCECHCSYRPADRLFRQAAAIARLERRADVCVEPKELTDAYVEIKSHLRMKQFCSSSSSCSTSTSWSGGKGGTGGRDSGSSPRGIEGERVVSHPFLSLFREIYFSLDETIPLLNSSSSSSSSSLVIEGDVDGGSATDILHRLVSRAKMAVASN